MGIDYSYEIYVHKRDAGRLLTEVAQLCEHPDRWTTVALFDGTHLRLPGSYGFKSGRTVALADAIGGGGSSFDLSPCFPVDEALQTYIYEYEADDARVWPDGTIRARVAYTYLTVHDDSSFLPEHLRFDFTPAVTSQSRLFLSSPSIRATFARLALSVHAPLCLLDVEERYNIVVTAQDRRVSADVPGPCVLWDAFAPPDQVYRSLLGWLAMPSSATTSEWIIGPDHAAYQAFVESLTRNSGVSGAVR